MIKIQNFLFKVKQQHTGKHRRPYIEEPVQVSQGDLSEKNQYSRTELRRNSREEPAQKSPGAQQREPSNYLFF
jgi:hypothetical protein